MEHHPCSPWHQHLMQNCTLLQHQPCPPWHMLECARGWDARGSGFDSRTTTDECVQGAGMQGAGMQGAGMQGSLGRHA
eukprot:10967146-Lingulodinium_polyedra.AAC.1